LSCDENEKHEKICDVLNDFKNGSSTYLLSNSKTGKYGQTMVRIGNILSSDKRFSEEYMQQHLWEQLFSLPQSFVEINQDVRDLDLKHEFSSNGFIDPNLPRTIEVYFTVRHHFLCAKFNIFCSLQASTPVRTISKLPSQLIQDMLKILKLCPFEDESDLFAYCLDHDSWLQAGCIGVALNLHEKVVPTAMLQAAVIRHEQQQHPPEQCESPPNSCQLSPSLWNVDPQK
jgi:hypothetical protein